MSDAIIFRNSTEFITIPLRGDVPTAADVAFTATPDGPPATWFGAEIVTGAVRYLLNPTAAGLAVGKWHVWVRLIDAPEAIIQRVGYITVY